MEIIIKIVIFYHQGFRKAADYVKGYDILFIDEAQKIENIGINLKILYDNFREKLKIIVTGSSSLEIANKIKEPLQAGIILIIFIQSQ